MVAPQIPFRLMRLSREDRNKEGELYYSVGDTLYGTLLVASSGQGVCYSTFVGECLAGALVELGRAFPKARLLAMETCSWFREILGLTHGILPSEPIPLVLYGTPLQHATWEALLCVELGDTRSYSEVAAMAGYPTAIRAVASAVARNIIVPFVPCHRVILSSGSLGQYSAEGGVERKRQLLLLEKSLVS